MATTLHPIGATLEGRIARVKRAPAGTGRRRMIGARSSKEGNMAHADTLRRIYDCINAHDVDAFAAHLAEDFVEHEVAPGLAPSKEGTRQFFQAYMAAFPDLRFEVEDILESGDKVVGRFRATGTHEGDFMGMPPTGNSFDVQGIDILRFAGDGLALEHWGVFDALTMMQQLGVVPAGPPG
jgi:steroid delta-isomerase-like uncharacterized protein